MGITCAAETGTASVKEIGVVEISTECLSEDGVLDTKLDVTGFEVLKGEFCIIADGVLVDICITGELRRLSRLNGTLLKENGSGVEGID